MKNTKLSAVITILMLLLVAGCGGGSKGGVTTPGVDPAPAAGGGGSGAPPAPKQEYVKVGPLKANQPGVMGPVIVTVGQMEGRAAGMTIPGFDYFLVEVTIENKTSAAININPLNIFQMEQPDGQKLTLNANAMTAAPVRLGDQVQPGQSIKGWVGFLTKLSDGMYKLHVRFPDHGEAIFEFEAPLM